MQDYFRHVEPATETSSLPQTKTLMRTDMNICVVLDEWEACIEVGTFVVGHG